MIIVYTKKPESPTVFAYILNPPRHLAAYPTIEKVANQADLQWEFLHEHQVCRPSMRQLLLLFNH